MSEVTRYDLTECVDTGDVDITPVPNNSEGRFVSYEDYLSLAVQLDNAESKCREMADLSSLPSVTHNESPPLNETEMAVPCGIEHNNSYTYCNLLPNGYMRPPLS